MAETNKRKTWRGNSSSSEESVSPFEKKARVITRMDSESTSEGDEVAEVLDLAKRVIPKLELVLQKLDSMEKKLGPLKRLVKLMDGRVKIIEEKVAELACRSPQAK